MRNWIKNPRAAPNPAADEPGPCQRCHFYLGGQAGKYRASERAAGAQPTCVAARDAAGEEEHGSEEEERGGDGDGRGRRAAARRGLAGAADPGGRLGGGVVGPVPVGEPLVEVAGAGVREAAAVLLPVLRHQMPRRGRRRRRWWWRPCSTAATSTMNGGGRGREGERKARGFLYVGDLGVGSWLIARDDG